MQEGLAAAIGDVQELVAYFRAGSKHRDARRIGLEHEKIGVVSDRRAPDHARIARLLEALAGRGWERVEEEGALIALKHPVSGSVTLEPGGQLEHSGIPWGSAVEANLDNDAHLDELVTLVGAQEMTLLGLGFRPFGSVDEVPWMPKGRYRVMRAYLPTRGTHALEMMKSTATVQANLDYLDEADAMDMLRVALGLSSLVTALFATSPLREGRPSGFQSYRARAWLDTDPDRCGLLPFAFLEGVGFADYVEWALDVPMFFVRRHGEYRPAGGMSFRQFLREGVDDERATMADWELHLSTLFPEARLKHYLEVRQADAGPREMVAALPALWRGILYDTDARAAAWSLVADWSYEERLALYRATPQQGMRASARGTPLRVLCGELVGIARGGLKRLEAGEEVGLLDPLERICREGRTVADRIIEDHARLGGDPDRLIDVLRLR